MEKKFDTEVYLTPKQAASLFNLSLSTVKNYIYAGKLKTLKTPGGHHRIPKSEILLTLGDRGFSLQEEDTFSMRLAMSNAMVALFNTFDKIGEIFVMHARNVSELSLSLARKISMDRLHRELTQIAGLVHDIGHIGIDRYIFSKPMPLLENEKMSLKMHPGIGARILSSIKGLDEIGDIVIQHHERIDGLGYPNGLKGGQIRIESRILAIVEAYDAMVSFSFYRKPLSKNEAISELVKNRGSQFDAELVDAFLKII